MLCAGITSIAGSSQRPVAAVSEPMGACSRLPWPCVARRTAACWRRSTRTACCASGTCPLAGGEARYGKHSVEKHRPSLPCQLACAGCVHCGAQLRLIFWRLRDGDRSSPGSFSPQDGTLRRPAAQQPAVPAGAQAGAPHRCACPAGFRAVLEQPCGAASLRLADAHVAAGQDGNGPPVRWQPGKSAHPAAADEPLDAATSILVVYFEPTEDASGEPGLLTLYELIVEHRGEGAYKASGFLGWVYSCSFQITVRDCGAPKGGRLQCECIAKASLDAGCPCLRGSPAAMVRCHGGCHMRCAVLRYAAVTTGSPVQACLVRPQPLCQALVEMGSSPQMGPPVTFLNINSLILLNQTAGAG